jgi:hypothetical protein
MSRVTNVILTAHVNLQADSDLEINSINKFLREAEGGGGGEFVEVSQLAGGLKHLECRVYISAFNHADLNAILQALTKLRGAISDGSGICERTGRRAFQNPLQRWLQKLGSRS